MKPWRSATEEWFYRRDTRGDDTDRYFKSNNNTLN